VRTTKNYQVQFHRVSHWADLNVFGMDSQKLIEGNVR